MIVQLPVPYEKRVVAFIDILGFRALVSKIQDDSTLHEQLFNALARIKLYKSISGDPSTAQKDIEVSVFSDSIVISAPAENQFDVIWTAIGLQSSLLEIGVLTRGGIASGLTYHKEDILYGEGMIKAYDLEDKAAVYPRIVLSPDIMGEVTNYQKEALLSQDVDGLWHTDPFAFGILPLGSEFLFGDGWDPHGVFLDDFQKTIDKAITEAKDVGVKAKWQWMNSKLADANAYHKKHGQTRLYVIQELAAERLKNMSPGAIEKLP